MEKNLIKVAAVHHDYFDQTHSNQTHSNGDLYPNLISWPVPNIPIPIVVVVIACHRITGLQYKETGTELSPYMRYIQVHMGEYNPYKGNAFMAPFTV